MIFSINAQRDVSGGLSVPITVLHFWKQMICATRVIDMGKLTEVILLTSSHNAYVPISGVYALLGRTEVGQLDSM